MKFHLAKKHLTTKQRSARSEKRAAEVLQGRRQPASGALACGALKGDVKSDKFVLEDKTTEHASYQFKLDEWRKLCREAFGQCRRPVFRMQIRGEAIYCLDEMTFQQLLRNELD